MRSNVFYLATSISLLALSAVTFSRVSAGAINVRATCEYLFNNGDIEDPEVIFQKMLLGLPYNEIWCTNGFAQMLKSELRELDTRVIHVWTPLSEKESRDHPKRCIFEIVAPDVKVAYGALKYYLRKCPGIYLPPCVSAYFKPISH